MFKDRLNIKYFYRMCMYSLSLSLSLSLLEKSTVKIILLRYFYAANSTMFNVAQDNARDIVTLMNRLSLFFVLMLRCHLLFYVLPSIISRIVIYCKVLLTYCYVLLAYYQGIASIACYITIITVLPQYISKEMYNNCH